MNKKNDTILQNLYSKMTGICKVHLKKWKILVRSKLNNKDERLFQIVFGLQKNC